MHETRRHPARRLTAALSIMLIGAGALCGPPVFAQAGDAPAIPEADVAPVWVQVPLPPGLSPDLLPPAAGSEAAQRLHLPLLEALGEVEPTAFDEAQAQPPVAELPARASEALERAQQLIDEGRSFEAGQALREAERLAPDHPDVIRALGLAYVRGGNPVRGLPHLRRAAAADPADVDVRVVLTRLALDRRAWGETLSLAAAIDAANAQAVEPDASAGVFADYVRAVTLGRQGHAVAAAELYRSVLASEPPEQSITAADREHYILQERAAALRLRLGDLELRLGNPAAALTAYEAAGLGQPEDPAGLAARLAYLHLQSSRPDEAEAIVVQYLASPSATEQDATLIAYLVAQGADPVSLDARLGTAMQAASADDFALVAARAVVLPQARTVELIADWLAKQPPRLAAFRRAVTLVRGAGDDADDPAALAQAVRVTAGEMQRLPIRAPDYSQAFLALDIDPVALLRALRRPEVAQQDDVMLLRLIGDAYAHVGRRHDASETLGRALDIDPGHTPTRRARVRLLLGLSGYDPAYLEQARSLLGVVTNDAPWEDFELSVDLLRYEAFALEEDEARRSRLLHDARRRVAIRLRAEPENLDLMLMDARVRAEARGIDDGIRAVRAVIEMHPEEERAYAAGIGLYSAVRRDEQRGLNLRRYFDFRQELLLRLTQNLPEAWTTRYELAWSYWFSQQSGMALPILEAMIEDDPEDRPALSLLVSVCEDFEDFEKARAYELRALALEPMSIRRAADRMRCYVRLGDPAQVVAIYEQAVALEAEGVMPGPPMTGDAAAALLFQLSLALGEAESEPQFLSMLRRYPDNAALNNGLGYRWAMAGKELLAAELMVRRAIDEGGERSSYLDSLAWVLYKMGRFAEAEQYMRQAIEAMVQEDRESGRGEDGAAKALYFDHLGDILYRQGETQAAAGCWDVARIATIDTEPALLDPETATVLERAAAKARAARAGREPEVSEVPGEPAFGDGVHPAERG